MSERIGALISNQRELTNAVSHELRTPIARLSFELDMMGRERDEAARLIEEMKNDVAELDSMASELLMYARLEHSDGLALQAQDARGWTPWSSMPISRPASAACVARWRYARWRRCT